MGLPMVGYEARYRLGRMSFEPWFVCHGLAVKLLQNVAVSANTIYICLPWLQNSTP